MPLPDFWLAWVMIQAFPILDWRLSLLCDRVAFENRVWGAFKHLGVS